ncbi:MAG: hypothetical protein GY759_12515 [Chloroflexi bacterium]|nr:hypothetical protein [Chloroflexota bacterium]
MKHRSLVALGLFVLLNSAFLLPMSLQMAVTTGGGAHYVAPAGACNGATPCYAAIQAAVDAANTGDLIKVAAGSYTDMHMRKGISQTVYISKTVTLQGGYVPDDWLTPAPDVNPTLLDAQGKGRVIYITGQIEPTIAGLQITGGNAKGLGDYWGYDAGSGMYVDGATATISDNIIYSNTEAYVGVGIFLRNSDSTVTENDIHHNTTPPGGEGGGIYVNDSAATISGNNIWANKAVAGTGGGIHLSYDQSIITDNVLSKNVASKGGGLFLNESLAQLERNIIRYNHATGAGGGLHIEGTNPKVINTVITDNTADMRGAGINLEGTQAGFFHTTLSGNSGGDGSGVYVGFDIQVAATVTFTNTIIAGHSTGLIAEQDNSATLNGSLWHDNGNNWNGSGAISRQHDHFGDPIFAPDGYHLTEASNARDKGVESGITVDIDQDARPLGDGYDLGADEFNKATVPKDVLYLPLAIHTNRYTAYSPVSHSLHGKSKGRSHSLR